LAEDNIGINCTILANNCCRCLITACFYSQYLHNIVLYRRMLSVKRETMPNTVSIPSNFTLRIGSRGSPLALAQVELTKAALKAAHPDLIVKVVIIQTTGDWKPEHGDTPLKDLQTCNDAKGIWAGKGLFVKEIEHALMNGDIDCAIHSAKDVETEIPEGLHIAHVLPREDAHDVLIAQSQTNISQNIRDLPTGYTIGTTSLRRQMHLHHMNPNLNIVPLRGNVQTRLNKMIAGQVDALILAKAGLNRLGIEPEFYRDLSRDDMLPSGGQGIVAIETRQNDAIIQLILGAISDAPTFLNLTAERAVLAYLGGSCHTPIGVHSTWQTSTQMRISAAIGHSDGSKIWKEALTESVETHAQAQSLGQRLGERVKTVVPRGDLESIL
jgi:hydroxymethylbilane synthase